jgi:acyl carrier protein
MIGAQSAADVSDHVDRAVRQIVADFSDLEFELVTRERRFFGDLPLDSLDVVEIVMRIEEHFEINVPDAAAEKLQCVGDAIDYVVKQIA